MWGDTFTLAEAEYCRLLQRELSGIGWMRPLLTKIEENGGITRKNKPILFELRFAAELHGLGLKAVYEYPTGIGNSTVDFLVKTEGIEWLIELVSLETTDAIKQATRTSGPFTWIELESSSTDEEAAESVEMIKAAQKIVVKATKFPSIQASRFHVIVGDMRGFLIGGGDVGDYRHIAYGVPGLRIFKESERFLVRLLRSANGMLEPIKGLFEKSNPLKDSPILHDRIHFLGFVNEKRYSSDCIRKHAYYLANPHLTTEDTLRKIFADYPMKPIKPEKA
jgi:hypothetical protein